MYLIIIHVVLISLMIAWQIRNVKPFFKLYQYRKEVSYYEDKQEMDSPFKIQNDLFRISTQTNGLFWILSLATSGLSVINLKDKFDSPWMYYLTFLLGIILFYLFSKNLFTYRHQIRSGYFLRMDDLFTRNLVNTMFSLNHIPEYELYLELCQVELPDILQEDLIQVQLLNKYGLQYLTSLKSYKESESLLINGGLTKQEQDEIQAESQKQKKKMEKIEQKISFMVNNLYPQFFEGEEEKEVQEEEVKMEEEEEEEVVVVETVVEAQVIQIGKTTFKNEWVVHVYAAYQNSNDTVIHHISGFEDKDEPQMQELLQTCEKMMKAEGNYETITGYEHWFTPSSLFESDWEGISPTVKRLAQDWSIDPTAPSGTPAKMTGYTRIQYDDDGNPVEN